MNKWVGIWGCFVSFQAFAVVECDEKITKLIPHENGGIYFQTEHTCSNNWCQIKWTGDHEKNRAFSLLLVAKINQMPVKFFWPTINSYDAKNVVYQSPGYVVF